MLPTNKDKLIKISVAGQIDSPKFPAVPWTPHFITREGEPSLLPTTGSIVYNVRVGDPALGWRAEVIEPGVSIATKDAGAHRALKVFSSVGNEAVVMTGRGKGAKGTVTGKTGRFADHVVIDFPPDVLDTLALGDTIVVRAFGLGLTVDGLESMRIKNIAPDLLDELGVAVVDGKLRVPVVKTLPAEMMGAGAGLDSDGGGLQIQAGSPGAIEKYDLAGLRLGDLVAILDYECTHAPGYFRGALSIGVVCHGDSVRAGFGPGMTIVMTASHGEIEPVQDLDANVARVLGIGAFRPT